MMHFRRIFNFGNYGWLGEYRLTSIVEAAKKVEKDLVIDDSNLPLDIFHSCYLLNIERNREDRIEPILSPVVSDEELRQLTVMDDMLSRVFAVKYLINLQKSQPGLNLSQLISVNNTGDSSLNHQVLEKCERSAKEYVRQLREFRGLMAGFGHSITFSESLSFNFEVDIHKLRMLLGQIPKFGREEVKSQVGTPSGHSLGRTPLSVFAQSIPDDVFWYRFATSSLPVYELTVGKEPKRILILLDKSSSMAGEKTLWARAVALAVVQRFKHVSLMFFDYEPSQVITDKHEILKTLVTLKSEGGTSISNALLKASHISSDITLLITDGEDQVSETFKFRKLIGVMVKGDNESLRK
ncbi:MAG: hypothetical protein QW223_08060, partial [Candidatus Caldarchaeum sp.]